MQHRLKLVCVATAATLIGATGAVAQDRIGDQPNINGIWQATNTAAWNIEPHPAASIPGAETTLGAIGAIPAGLGVIEGGGTIPYLPEALAVRDANRASAPGGDPEAKCYLPGIPRATYMSYPFQIIQDGVGDMLFVYEYGSANRVIHLEEHNEPPIETWMGLSNGTWEGDTLVVQTLAQNGQTWLDRSGNYLSSQAVVTERFSVIDANHLQYEATIEDPTIYSEAWTISMPLYRRVEPNAQILEFKCVPFAEELLYGDLKPEGVE